MTPVSNISTLLLTHFLFVRFWFISALALHNILGPRRAGIAQIPAAAEPGIPKPR